MKLKFKKTVIALLVTSLLPFYAQSDELENEQHKNGYDLINDPSFNLITIERGNNSLQEHNGSPYKDGEPITENNVVHIKYIQDTSVDGIRGGGCIKTSEAVVSHCYVENTAIVFDDGVVHSMTGAYAYGINEAHAVGQAFINNTSTVTFAYGATAQSYNNTSTGTIANVSGNLYVNDSSTVSNVIGADSYSDYKSTSIGNVYVNDDVRFTYASSSKGAYSAVTAKNVNYSSNNDLYAIATGNLYFNNNQVASENIGAEATITPKNNNLIANATAIGNVVVNSRKFDHNSNNATQVIKGAVVHIYDQDNMAGNAITHAIAKGNVFLNNDAAVGDIYGVDVAARGNVEATIVAEGNVYLNDNALVTGSIYATKVMDARKLDEHATVNATAKGNVSLYGNVRLGSLISQNNIAHRSEIWGSFIETIPTYYQIFNGNTFTMGANPITVTKLGNFENYYFYLNDYNKAAIANGSALVTITQGITNNNTVVNNGGTAVTTTNKSNIKINGISGEGITHVGDVITLIDASAANVTFTGGDNTSDIAGLFDTPTNNTVDVGLVGKADISYSINSNNTITATIDHISTDNVNATEKVKPLAEGRLAGLQNTTRGADLLLSTFDDKTVAAGQFTPIAVLDGGVSKYNSGSHVDARDYRMMVGTRYQLLDNLYMGFTAEYGRSNYDTYNEFTTKKVKGNGHNTNYGLSLFGQYQHDLSVGYAYSNAAVRFGRTSTEYNSNDIITGSGDAAHYKSKVNYIGGLIGTGYVYPINNESSFDSSIHYFYTRLGSDSVTIDGDKVNFDKSTSSRVQLKEQYNYQSTKHLTFSLAGIYEYEFDSDAKTNVSGISIDAPSVKGSTGIMELGIKAMPITDNDDLSLHLNVRGYKGKRDGASVSALVKYDF